MADHRKIRRRLIKCTLNTCESMNHGQGEWHRLRKLIYEKWKCKKKRVNKRKTKIYMGGIYTIRRVRYSTKMTSSVLPGVRYSKKSNDGKHFIDLKVV